MKKLGLLLALVTSILTLTLSPAIAQHYRNYAKQSQGGMIIGKVIDTAGIPLEYTTVTLYKSDDSSIVDGTFTDTLGRFVLKNLPWGEFFLEVKFIGFTKKIITGIKLSPSKPIVRIGRIQLKPSVQELDQIIVTGQKSALEYQVDKKVINVSQNLTSISGTAVDLLQNIPSVEVDIQGNVSLRGSSNFTVFINGKPSVLEGNEALQQIPASEIEKIEIITNPSAKYDPDGVVGIINIITRRPKQKGYNGYVSVSVDNYNSINANIILNVRKPKYNWFIGFDRNQRIRPSTSTSVRKILYDSLTNTLTSQGNSAFQRSGWSFKTGFDLYPSKNNIFNISLKAGARKFEMYSESFMTQSLNWDTIFYKQNGSSQNAGLIYQADAQWIHYFNSKNKQLTAMLYLSNWEPQKINEISVDTTNEDWQTIAEKQYAQQSQENRKILKARAQLDYSHQWNNQKLELGYSARYLNLIGDYNLFIKQDNLWTPLPQASSQVTFNRQIHAAYLTYKTLLFNWLNLQIGLRTEYTNRQLLRTDSANFSLNRIDLFPSVHLNKNFGNWQIQLSYSRRINRPSGWRLNPFPLYINQYTIVQGNPELLPEYADLVEFNIIKNFKSRSFISLESFVRRTKNRIQRIQTPSDLNTIMLTYLNAGQDLAAGSELNINIRPKRFISINLASSVFYYQIEGELNSQYVKNSTISWKSRFMLMAMMPTKTKLQITGFYRAPTVTLQGYRKAIIMTSVAIAQDMFNRKLSIILNISDPLKITKFHTIIETPQLFSETIYTPLSPRFTLTINWRINNYKPQRSMKRNEDVTEFEGEGLY